MMRWLRASTAFSSQCSIELRLSLWLNRQLVIFSDCTLFLYFITSRFYCSSLTLFSRNRLHFREQILIWGSILLTQFTLNISCTLLSHFAILGRFSPFVIICNRNLIYFRGFLLSLYNYSLSLNVKSIEESIQGLQQNSLISHHLYFYMRWQIHIFKIQIKNKLIPNQNNEKSIQHYDSGQTNIIYLKLLQQTNIMGGKNSQPARKVNHFYFGDVVRKKSFNKEVLSVTRPILSQAEFDEWKQKYDSVNDMNKESLFVPLGFDYRKLDTPKLNCRGCCGAEAESEMTYQDVDFTLYSEVANRSSKKRQYSEAELLYLLYKLLQGGKQFQKKNIHFGDIRTRNILITREGEVKMVNIASFPSERTSIEKILDGFDNTTAFFLAPEQIDYVKSRGTAKSDLPNPKTQAWSIGLCVLEAATLQHSQTLYQMPSRKLKEELLNKRMRKVQQKYRTLYDFLSMIIKQDISQRMTSGQCWASMRPYSQKITELEPIKRNPVAQNTSIRKYQTQGSGRR